MTPGRRERLLSGRQAGLAYGRCWPRVCECDVNEEAKDRFFGATEVDEGRPLDVGRQRQASNQAVRLGFKRPWS
jgi:hypothetical protein